MVCTYILVEGGFLFFFLNIYYYYFFPCPLYCKIENTGVCVCVHAVSCLLEYDHNMLEQGGVCHLIRASAHLHTCPHTCI